jgi:hypothetical protein
MAKYLVAGGAALAIALSVAVAFSGNSGGMFGRGCMMMRDMATGPIQPPNLQWAPRR